MKLKVLLLATLLSSSSQVFAEAAETAASSAITAATEKSAEVTKDVQPVPAQASQKESEIALNFDQKKSNDASEGVGYRLILTLGIVAVLAGGVLFFVKKYARPKASKHQMQIKVLTQHYLGPKKSLAVIRVAGESILIGVTDHSINAIKTLSLLDEELPTDLPTDFNETLKFDEAPVKGAQSFALSSKAEVSDDEFSIAGIQSLVKNKLKDMRSL